MAQWFPVLQSEEAPFLVQGEPSGAKGATAKVTITLDTYPHLLYGFRFDVSYEIPPSVFGQVPAFKRDMRDGGVDDDYDVTILLTQQNIASKPTHVRNVRGAKGTNQHPLAVFYPLRGTNNITIEAVRNSSYAQIRAGDVLLDVFPVWKVTLDLARGVQQIADNASGPPAPGSSGYP